MTRIAFTNIQRRTNKGSLIGLASDVTLEVRSDDLDEMGDALRVYLGDKGSPSFSYEVVE